MNKQCGKEIIPYVAGKRDECRNSASRICASCGRHTCSGHARDRCPQGRNTSYGIVQHLTVEERLEIDHVARFKLNKIHVGREQTDNRTKHQAPSGHNHRIH